MSKLHAITAVLWPEICIATLSDAHSANHVSPRAKTQIVKQKFGQTKGSKLSPKSREILDVGDPSSQANHCLFFGASVWRRVSWLSSHERISP